MAIQATLPSTTTDAEATRAAAMLLTRLSRMASVPHFRFARTADPLDVERTRAAIDLAHDVFVSHVGRLIGALAENLPFKLDDIHVYFAGLADIRNELDGLLMQAGERLES